MLGAAVFLPLVGILVCMAVPGRRPGTIKAVGVGFAAIPLVVLVAAWVRFDTARGGFQLVESAPWIPTLGVGYRLGVDGISLPLAVMTAGLFVAALAYPVDMRSRPRHYVAAFLFLETVSLGVFLALDLFLFYVFFDLSLVGMYFLIAIWGHGDSRRSALKFFLYTLAGSLVMLLAILGLYLATSPRTFDMAEIIRQQPLAGNGLRGGLVFLGFLVGFGIKTPIVPFHTWLPPAHVDAPAPASTILAGVLLKMGTYGLIRIPLAMLPGSFRAWAPLLATLGVVSILYGSLVALAQTNLKRLIAYTSVNHMGYVVLGIAAAGAVGSGRASARSLALTGATVEMVAHGLITGALFLLSGSVWRRSETYEMTELGGLAGRAPVFATAMIVAAFASLGLPGLAGFVAEIQIFAGTFSVYPLAAAVGVIGILITAGVFLRTLSAVLFGGLPPRWAAWSDLDRAERATLGPMMAMVVIIGVVPAWLLGVIDATARAMVAK